ncbi:transcriptional regulator [Microbacterium sp. CH12i]|uniref:GntR family transcriptional regulator n=1 Tax=Microbacterium sp. CH12i TaxID=1479651 RepID=UPI000461CD18|nr:GntR family transcriptional regulator [Microbacterium sp. CH12i]KDA05018.1 transcriptional regulator [Microbacterium sp. CH12i]
MAGVGGSELESVRVTRLLRDDIVAGRRLPGARLVERDIAAELEVSRLPVREAIRALVADGIVVARPRSWAVVREFTLRDIQDFAEVRASVETQLFVLAAQRHDEAGLAELNQIVEREELAAIAGDTREARVASGMFHEHMAVLADNEMLIELVSVFATRMKWLFGMHSDLILMAAEHRELYEAIAMRDTGLVRTMATVHLASGSEIAEEHFRSMTSRPGASQD